MIATVAPLPMRIRVVTALGLGYVVLALLGHGLEGAGKLTCECLPDCWCKRRGVALFRWIFPFRHRLSEASA